MLVENPKRPFCYYSKIQSKKQNLTSLMPAHSAKAELVERDAIARVKAGSLTKHN